MRAREHVITSWPFFKNGFCIRKPENSSVYNTKVSGGSLTYHQFNGLRKHVSLRMSPELDLFHGAPWAPVKEIGLMFAE